MMLIIGVIAASSTLKIGADARRCYHAEEINAHAQLTRGNITYSNRQKAIKDTPYDAGHILARNEEHADFGI